MKCPYCGADNPDWGLLCEECGKALKKINPKDLQKTINVSQDDISPVYESKAHFSFDDADEDEQETDKVEETKEVHQVNAGGKFNSFKEKLFNSLFEEVVVDENGKVVDADDQEIEEIPEENERMEEMPTHERRFNYDEEEVDEIKSPKRLSFDYKKYIKPVLIAFVVIALLMGGYKVISSLTKPQSSSVTTQEKKKNVEKKEEKKVEGLKIASVSATSTLIEQGFDHSASNLIDGDSTTAWNEGASGYGFKESVTFTLSEEQEVASMTILNGYCKSQESYTNNNRVKQLLVYFDDGTSQRITLTDVFNQKQTIQFAKSHKTKTIRLQIREVYRGSKYNDTCISEVSFN